MLVSTERVQEVYNRSLLESLTEYSDIYAQGETLRSWKRMMTSEPETEEHINWTTMRTTPKMEDF